MSKLPLVLLSLLSSWLIAPALQADYLSLCDEFVQTENNRFLSRAYLGAEEVFLAASSQRPEEAGCSLLEIPADSSAIRWGALVTSAVNIGGANQLILQGSFSSERDAVSEIIFNEPPPSPGYLPLMEDILPAFSSRTFGVENRASLNDGLIQCEAGDSVAGVLMQTEESWPSGIEQSLVLTGTGSGRFEVAVSDQQRQVAQTPQALGPLVLSGTDKMQLFDFALPTHSQWQSLTLVCPPEQAEIQLENLFIKPTGDQRVEDRSAWFWRPALWMQTPDIIWRAARQEGISEIYITVLTSPAGEVSSAPQLEDFIQQSAERGIRVWAVIGERHDVLPENLPLSITRVNAYRQYNQSHPNAQLAGVQLDIEPYLLPGFTLNQAYWRERYLQTVTAIHAELEQSLALDLVVPVWWGNHPSWGTQLLDNLALPGLSFTVMNYRTDPGRIRRAALPFFVWAEAHQMKVRMALEAGPLGDETRLRYVAARDAGDLWLTRLGDRDVLLLLDDTYSDIEGKPYTYHSQDVFLGDNLSFADNLDQLTVLAKILEAEWSVWSSFSGLAIHGLDTIYVD